MKAKIMPPTYFMALLLLSVAFHFIFPIFKLVSSPYNYIGILFIAFGIVLNLWADSLFKKKQTTVKPHEMPNSLIDYGPFKISRHPMYLGMLSIIFGAAFFLGSISSLVFSILFVIIAESLFIPMEEKNLEKRFGKRYAGYKRRVRRWI
ncbi:isoprenylcysteine carboxylmethyltransferase family protein [Candidatus Woesearchaeota archaeon]|nr:isoprenylcysteine carboxylmethyltransferase family protein [Candidatus Woesearchaeota archaeon]